jgi:hypothetical protein
MRKANVFSATVMVLPFVCFWTLTGCPSSAGTGGGSGIVEADVLVYGVISGSVVVVDRGDLHDVESETLAGDQDCNTLMEPIRMPVRKPSC